jgi:hypothetical protein
MFFASNWFYTYQFNDVNLPNFNIRTRALNNVLYWMSQIIGAYVFGYCLDIRACSRRLRAKIGLAALFVITMGMRSPSSSVPAPLLMFGSYLGRRI